jgi:hypothetical protein
MALSSTTITCMRYVYVEEPLDLTPLLAKHPGARPERLIAVHASAVSLDTASVTLVYDHGVRCRVYIKLDEYNERTTGMNVIEADKRILRNPDEQAAVLDDIDREAVLHLAGDIGHKTLHPEWPDYPGGLP